MKAKKAAKSPKCQHPATRLFAWVVSDGTLCVGCCVCGQVLKGGATLND